MWHQIAFLLIVLVVSIKYKSRLKSFYIVLKCRFLLEKLPNTPGREFLIGHARQFLWLSPEALFLKLREIVKQSKDVSVSYTPAAGFANVKGPEEVEAIIGHDKNYDKAFTYNFVTNWLGRGLLTCKGGPWKSRRKLLAPAFHFSILLEFVNIFNKHTRSFLAEVEKYYLDVCVDVVPLVSDFTLATIGETSLGLHINFASEEGIEYKNAIYQMGAVVFKRVIYPWLWPDFLFNFSRFRKMEVAALKVLQSFTAKIIKKRSESFRTFDEKFDDGIEKRKCPLIDVLLNGKLKHGIVDDTDIRDDVETFVFAGHDTSAMCINYTMMLLSCNKNIQDKVFQEIVKQLGPDITNEPSYADLQELNLLERCIKESLRLYPPVPTIGRFTNTNVDTKYGTIPKRVDVFISIYDIHRDPRFWPNPEVFDPSRHLPENSQGRPAYAYIPFSAGPRNCIGQRFAMLEIKSFFCGLLRKFILEPIDTPETLVLTQEIILRPKNGIKLKFRLRET